MLWNKAASEDAERISNGPVAWLRIMNKQWGPAPVESFDTNDIVGVRRVYQKGIDMDSPRYTDNTHQQVFGSLSQQSYELASREPHQPAEWITIDANGGKQYELRPVDVILGGRDFVAGLSLYL
jgi:hypothetical protein